MKKIVFSAGLIVTLVAMPLLIAAPPTAAQELDEIEDMRVEELGPFEKADPGEIGISEVKAEQLKKATHTIVKRVRPPRINGERLQDFKEPNINVKTVKPFDKRDLLSPLALPLPEKEFAAALEFQDLDDRLRGRTRVEQDHGLSADAPLVHIPTPPKEPVRFVVTRDDPGIGNPPSSGQTPESGDEAGRGRDTREASRAGRSGDPAKEQEAGGVIRLENRLDRVDMNALQLNNEEAREAVAQEADNADEGREKAFKFSHMAGTDQFRGTINGIPGSAQPMSVETGSASMDKAGNLKISVENLRNADGSPATGQRFGAGVACMDSGYFEAGGDGEQGFILDETGSAEFTGKLDFAGQGCVAPAPMIVNEEGSFVAVGAHSIMDFNGMPPAS